MELSAGDFVGLGSAIRVETIPFRSYRGSRLLLDIMVSTAFSVSRIRARARSGPDSHYCARRVPRRRLGARKCHPKEMAVPDADRSAGNAGGERVLFSSSAGSRLKGR